MPTKNEGTGLAGGLIVTALLDTLMAKEVITKTEIRDILRGCIQAIGPDDAKTPEGYAAAQMLMGLMGGKFSERS